MGSKQCQRRHISMYTNEELWMETTKASLIFWEFIWALYAMHCMYILFNTTKCCVLAVLSGRIITLCISEHIFNIYQKRYIAQHYCTCSLHAWLLPCAGWCFWSVRWSVLVACNTYYIAWIILSTISATRIQAFQTATYSFILWSHWAGYHQRQCAWRVRTRSWVGCHDALCTMSSSILHSDMRPHVCHTNLLIIVSSHSHWRVIDDDRQT